MTRATGIAAALAVLMIVGQADAQTVGKQPDGSITWQAGIDGAVLEFNPDGTLRRIYSKYSQPVTIADKRGIHTAMVIAEEKGKANIVRFLQQTVATHRLVNEFESTASNTTQAKAGAGDSLTTVDQRAVSQSLDEFTGSFSSGTLTGVVVLENGYDEKEREAWVVVGLSQKTMAAAKAAQDMMSDPGKPQAPAAAAPAPAAPPKSLLRQGNQDF